MIRGRGHPRGHASRLQFVLFAALALGACRSAPPLAYAPADVPCWAGQRLGTHGRVAFFCEANRNACIAQPANTWSNIAYVLGAASMLAGLLRPGRERRMDGAARVDRAFGALLAGQALYLGVGSALFHASVTAWAERLDLSGTYGVVLTLLGYAAARIVGPERPGAVVGSVVAVLGLQVVITVFKWQMEDFLILPLVIAALLVALATLVRQGQLRGTDLRPAAAAALAAGAVWGLDLSRALCEPDSLVQGHAAWHVLTAGAVVLTARTIRGAAS